MKILVLVTEKATLLFWYSVIEKNVILSMLKTLCHDFKACCNVKEVYSLSAKTSIIYGTVVK